MAPAPQARPISHLSVHAVNIYVRDQDRSLQFYVDKLGFQLAFDARLPTGERWVAVTPPDGSAVLALIAPRPKSPDAKRIGRATGVILVTADVAAQFREWSMRGVRFRHTPRLRRVQYEPLGGSSTKAAVWGGVFTRFEDIDRNVFELVSFDAVSEAIENQRRQVADKLVRIRAASGAGARNRQAGSGAPLPPVLATPENAQLRGALRPGQAGWR